MKSKFPLSDIAGEPLVLDASAIINLLATGIPAAVLQGLKMPALVVEEALAEVTRHPIPGEELPPAIERLISGNLLDPVQMSVQARTIFHELVAADLTGGLDDGEAATIAVTLEQFDNAVAIIDEKKGARLFHDRAGGRQLVDSVSLLAHLPLRGGISGPPLADAVFSALRHARMRVPPEALHWVVELIGVDRARQCTSISRQSYRSD